MLMVQKYTALLVEKMLSNMQAEIEFHRLKNFKISQGTMLSFKPSYFFHLHNFFSFAVF